MTTEHGGFYWRACLWGMIPRREVERVLAKGF